MVLVWDYNKEELEKDEKGRILLLERMVNYGPQSSKGEKINLQKVKKYWNKINLFPKRKRLMKLLIWEKPQS